MESLSEQIKRGRALIGKKARFLSGIGVVSHICVATSIYDHVVKSDGDTIKLSETNFYAGNIATINQSLIDHGAVVCVYGTSVDDGRPFKFNILQNVTEYTPEPWEEVKVNGYWAKKTETGFNFGCADISTKQLVAAYGFLEDQPERDNSNREIVSVKIGVGDFTLPILKKLLGK